MGNTVQRRAGANTKEDAQEKEVGSYFLCEICIESVPSEKRFRNKHRNCVHPFCMDCIEKYIHVKVEDNFAIIACPALDCKQHLDPIICRPLIPGKLFDKWCDNLFDSAILGLDKCYCPNQECSALVVNECRGTIMKSKCPNCKTIFCFKCKSLWHSGYRCDESGKVRDLNDTLFGIFVEEKKLVRCPGCGHVVQRINGCSRVTCRCKTSFCTICGAEFSKRKWFCRCQHDDFFISFISITILFVLVLLSFILRNLFS